jgi:hypothetical protein
MRCPHVFVSLVCYDHDQRCNSLSADLSAQRASLHDYTTKYSRAIGTLEALELEVSALQQHRTAAAKANEDRLHVVEQLQQCKGDLSACQAEVSQVSGVVCTKQPMRIQSSQSQRLSFLLSMIMCTFVHSAMAKSVDCGRS